MSRRKPIEEIDPHAPVLKIFFPHSRKDYGSERSAAAERAIKTAWPGCEIIDPRYINWKKLSKEEGSSASADELVVRECNIVAALEHQNHIGRGVFGGLKAGLSLGRATYVVRGTKLVRVIGVATVDVDDWAVRFGRAVTEDDDGVPDPDPTNGADIDAWNELIPADGDK